MKGAGRHAEYALALVLDLVGAGVALLVGGRAWQTITVARPRPLADITVEVSGRTLDSAATALSLVALAGVVAVLATRGRVRQAVGAIIALAGAGLVWRAAEAFPAVSPARARTLVTDSRRAGSDLTAAPQVTVHSAWPVLLLVCGVLVALAGTLVAARSRRWGAMSARYENRAVAESSAREAAEQDPQKAAASLWTALDRGEDPTSG